MSGELQTIPARHGVATFVPRGRTIKVINTYGKQVVSMWAFALGAPPEEGDDDVPGDEEIEQGARELQEAAEKDDKESKEGETPAASENQTSKQSSEQESKVEESVDQKEKKEQEVTSKAEGSKEEHEDPPEQAPDTPNNEKSTETTNDSTKETETTDSTDGKTSKQPSKRTWASYLPSIPYRAKTKGAKADTKPEDADAEQEPSPEEQTAQNEANTKKWSAYIPTGKGFSNYIPNVEVPSKEGVVSAFKSSHPRDPNKSYAEQLYDFSKTPVGAGTIAAATGSGYASSVYAAYTAYTQSHPRSASQPLMEYLSLPHTRASSQKLVPDTDDTLLTNLRNPILTLLEDTSPGAHDALSAACDANLYAALGVDKPAEHGSCAENLVLALKEMNENAGLKGARAVGADISVNIAPTPLHLFMAAPVSLPEDAESAKSAGSGAKGATFTVEEPRGKKRGFVRFRAERDVVVVFSACPMDVGPQNGGRCMAANFMVEEEAEAEDSKGEKEKAASSKGSKDGKKTAKTAEKKTQDKKPDTTSSSTGTAEKEKSGPASKAPPPAAASKSPKDNEGGAKKSAQKSEPRTESAVPASSSSASEKEDGKEKGEAKDDEKDNEPAKPAKKKPKKLQVRSKA